MAPRPSYDQIEAVVEFLEQNPGIAKGLLRTSSAKAETKKKWATLAIKLNSLGGAEKDGTGWAKYWSEKKCTLKKHAAIYNGSIKRTGGGPAEVLPPLSCLELRMIAIMGGLDFGTGEPGLAPNPFPNSDVIMVPNDAENVLTLPDTLTGPDLDDVSPTSPIFHTHRAATEKRERSPYQMAPTPPQRVLKMRPKRTHKVTHSNSVETEMDRLAKIELRRVEAENRTAQAFSDQVAHIDRMAGALENMATSLSSLASAIYILANRPN